MSTFIIPKDLINQPHLVLDYVAVEIAERLCAYPIAKDIYAVKEVLQQYRAYIQKYASN